MDVWPVAWYLTFSACALSDLNIHVHGCMLFDRLHKSSMNQDILSVYLCWISEDNAFHTFIFFLYFIYTADKFVDVCDKEYQYINGNSLIVHAPNRGISTDKCSCQILTNGSNYDLTMLSMYKLDGSHITVSTDGKYQLNITPRGGYHTSFLPKGRAYSYSTNSTLAIEASDRSDSIKPGFAFMSLSTGKRFLWPCVSTLQVYSLKPCVVSPKSCWLKNNFQYIIFYSLSRYTSFRCWMIITSQWCHV